MSAFWELSCQFPKSPCYVVACPLPVKRSSHARVHMLLPTNLRPFSQKYECWALEMLFFVTFGCMVRLLGESGIVVFWSASCISVHRPPKQPRKSIQYYFAIYPRINGQVSKDAWRSILAPFFLGFRCRSSSSDTERTARREC